MDAPPSYPIDFYSEALIRDPHPHYRAIRDLGAAVWLPRHELWAVGRYADARKCLAADDVLLSGKGVAANAVMNRDEQIATLISDGDRHRTFKRIVMKPIQPGALKLLRERIRSSADELVDRLVERGSFDGMLDLAQHLPLSIVAHLVGLPDAGREKLLYWAAGTFDALGSLNRLGQLGLRAVNDVFAYARALRREDVDPGGWAIAFFDAADAGVISHDAVFGLMLDYIAPSLDTTIFAMGHMVHQLGLHPEQWEALRADPSLVSGAVEETLRYEAPIRAFTRHVAEDFELDGAVLPAGARAVVIYGSANRDERRYPDPDRFDIRRGVHDHLGFGYGVHRCVGVHLARLEMNVLLEAMVARVRRIEVGEPTVAINNVLRGFDSLPVTFSR